MWHKACNDHMILDFIEGLLNLKITTNDIFLSSLPQWN